MAIRTAQERGLGSQIDGLVITLPAKFSYLEKNILYKSAQNCLDPGNPIRITGILKEPVAAALHCFRTGIADNEHILVFDLGGGTCDVALVKADSSSDDYYVVVDSGMKRIGGRDWDEKIAQYAVGMLEEKYSTVIGNDPSLMKKVREASEAAKRRLTDRDLAVIRVEHNSDILSGTLKIDQFEEITEPLMNEALECLQTVYDRNKERSISRIVCVGGSAKMRQVKRRIQERFADCEVRISEPEYAVVKGAAYYANLVGNRVYPVSAVLEKADFSYGLHYTYHPNKPDECYHICNLVQRGKELPYSGEGIFWPLKDNQSGLWWIVYEVETDSKDCHENAYPKMRIGEFNIDLPPGTKAGTEIRARMTLNVDGILEVEAWKLSGEKVSAHFNVIR